MFNFAAVYLKRLVLSFSVLHQTELVSCNTSSVYCMNVKMVSYLQAKASIIIIKLLI